MSDFDPSTSRRELLRNISAVSLCSLLPISACTVAPATGRRGALPEKATALPLSRVRLLPSPFADAVEANQRYLMMLEADRFLHNFRRFAGLEPKGEIYGGWEGDTIAGHSLGHYMTALALSHAQTGSEEAKRRLAYILDQLVEVQTAQGDGYVAGFTRRRQDGTLADGREIFPEISAGDIRSAGFDLNGCWVPFYNWHKLYAGLFAAQTHCDLDRGIDIAVKLGGYIERVFNALDDAQVQTVLDCEHGGINESFAELHARTGDPRWLALAQRLYHRRALAPLVEQRDELANLHANTQIPKLIGLARLHELTGNADCATAARFFWSAVTGHHSYVIGGNSDREYFSTPDTIAAHITEQTCEACNSYNMLKLTRHLYAWRPHAALFDYYERTHLNHILAQIDPADDFVEFFHRRVGVVLEFCKLALEMAFDLSREITFGEGGKRLGYLPQGCVSRAHQEINSLTDVFEKTRLIVQIQALTEVAPARRLDDLVDLPLNRHLRGAILPLHDSPQEFSFDIANGGDRQIQD